MIQYQILKTNIARTVWQTVRRITNEILGVKGLTITATCVVVCMFVNHPPYIEWDNVGNLKNQLKKKIYAPQVIERIKENHELIIEYEKLATDLLEWIQITIVKLSDRKFANTLVGVQQEMLEFNQYRTQEKPPRLEKIVLLIIVSFCLR